MKSILIILVSVWMGFAGHAQEINDNFSEAVTIQIHQQAVTNYERIAELKNWMTENNVQHKIAAGHVLFRWPMRVNSNYDDVPNYYMIQNYVDQYRQQGDIKDFHCTSRTYNSHEGIDINLFPFWWRMKDRDNVFACAGAPGIVIAVVDNINNDDNCVGDTLGANHIAILHADSSISRYLHLKRNSARVQLNQFVEEGQLLANIASSGRSSNPHLHFDVRDRNNDWIEPNFSTNASFDCNILNDDSWWQDQKPFFEPQINRVVTHSAVPVLNGLVNNTQNDDFCKASEQPRLKNQFSGGELVTIGVALHDAYTEDSLIYTVTNSINNVIYQFREKVTAGIYNNRWTRFYRTRGFTLPSPAPVGTYTVNVGYKHKLFSESIGTALIVTTNYKHFFTVSCTGNKTLTGATTGVNGHIVSNNLSSSQSIQSGRTMYQSANEIVLTPGFAAVSGTTFKARIRDCNFVD